MKKFYQCGSCGKLVGLIQDGTGELACCGEPMKLLEANTTDGAQEKHVPVYEINGDILTVTIGEVTHPMADEHSIQWVMVTQEHHTQRVELAPGNEPKAVFSIEADKPFAVYEYCNLHGLWKADSK